MIGTIHIEKCKIDSFIGVYEHEKESSQSLSIDIVLRIDLTKCIYSDQIEDATDYDKVIALCKKIATLRHYHLLENLAHSLLEALFDTFTPLGLKIILKKELSSARAAIILQKGEL